MGFERLDLITSTSQRYHQDYHVIKLLMMSWKSIRKTVIHKTKVWVNRDLIVVIQL